MDAELNHRLDYEKRQLVALRDICAERLEKIGGMEHVPLRTTRRAHGGKYYYARMDGARTYTYLGNKDRPEVKRIKEAHAIREYIRRIDVNINAINGFLNSYLPYDGYSVNEHLAEIYRMDMAPASEAYRIEGENWLADRKRFQSQYPENYPEKKTERTSDGTMVKTVSEVVLYERLKSAGFCFIYELPLVMNDYGPALYPDFTVLSPIDMKTEVIIEYSGRLDLPRYREDFARRIGRYMEKGYIPGVNLFFAFGDSKGHIDSMQINRIIAEIRGI